MVRQLQSIGERWFFNVRLQSCPAGKPSLASDGELRIAQLQRCSEDLRVRGAAVTRMKLPDPLGCSGSAGFLLLEQVFGLIPEVIEVGIRGEASYRHNELPFVCPRSAFDGQKVSSRKRIVAIRWTSVLSADRMRPSALR